MSKAASSTVLPADGAMTVYVIAFSAGIPFRLKKDIQNTLRKECSRVTVKSLILLSSGLWSFLFGHNVTMYL